MSISAVACYCSGLEPYTYMGSAVPFMTAAVPRDFVMVEGML